MKDIKEVLFVHLFSFRQLSREVEGHPRKFKGFIVLMLYTYLSPIWH